MPGCSIARALSVRTLAGRLARAAPAAATAATAATAAAARLMHIGVPKEVKPDEYRVSLVPASVDVLTQAGHKVFVQTGAGEGSGICDEDFENVGATIVATAKEAWDQEMVIKVKEPYSSEYELIDEQLVFTYFHLAASRELTETLLSKNATCLAYETVQRQNGSLPLLLPMSEVAGSMSIQEGAKYLERPFGGRGKLLCGVPGVAPGRVLVIGGGIVGANACRVAAGLGAQVTVVDTNVDRLRYLDDIFPENVSTVFSTPLTIQNCIQEADVVIGAVYTIGEKAPKLIRREHLEMFNPRAVLVDVSIDQGGVAETSRPTTHSDPVYIENGVVHYCVGNIPGAVPGTSTYALTNVTLPYALQLANLGWKDAIKQLPELEKGINIFNNTITHPGVARAFPDLPSADVQSMI